MKNQNWKICMKLDSSTDAALIVTMRAQKHFWFEPFELMTRRLAVHEAVLNALKYGGGGVLKACGRDREMRVEISQQKPVVFPLTAEPFRGTALIRRYARETEVSPDKKTLILLFY